MAPRPLDRWRMIDKPSAALSSEFGMVWERWPAVAVVLHLKFAQRRSTDAYRAGLANGFCYPFPRLAAV